MTEPYEEETLGIFQGVCAGCDTIGQLDDLSLCEESGAKLERDLIRKKDWDYCASAFGLSPEQREELFKNVLKHYGKALELIAPNENSRKKRKR